MSVKLNRETRRSAIRPMITESSTLTAAALRPWAGKVAFGCFGPLCISPAFCARLRPLHAQGTPARYTGTNSPKRPKEAFMDKAIITVVGQDTVGIIARVCTYLADHRVNVLDISQTIIDGFFNMMMIADFNAADEDFGTLVEGLETLGDEIGVRIRCQREEIFTKMHRV